MTYFRLGLCAAALSFSSCNVSTAPEPAEFQLSADALSKQYRATRKTGSVRLYAQKIETTRDAWGRETHRASGGALLVKETHPPIYAQAPEIAVTPDFSEVSGRSTVKKDDRLYLGEDESTKIRIDGTAIKPEGPHAVRGIAAAVDVAALKAQAEAKAQAKAAEESEAQKLAEAKALAKAESLAAEESEAKAKAETRAQAKAQALAEKEAKANAKAEAQMAEREAMTQAKAERERATAEAQARKNEAQAKAEKEQVLAEAMAKKKAEAQAKVAEEKTRAAQASLKAAAKPPAAAPAAPVDRSKLLNLMREPTER